MPTLILIWTVITALTSCNNAEDLSDKIGTYPLPAGNEYEILEKTPVELTWSATRVGYSLLTQDEHQFVAYYDANKQMTVAQRTINSTEWTFKRLPSYIGWDSHNYITIALDKEGYLHVSGNMHVVPLIYFRTSKPYDVTTLEQHTSMVGEYEQKVTYPVFLKNQDNELIFTYRDGSSGSGSNYYNIYDTKTKTWKRLFDQPFTDGEGQMNAYNHGPIQGPDGWFHMSWIWRDTPAAETNHDLSYAKSPDLINWYTVNDDPITLPIKFTTPGVIVDPVPTKCGIINGNGRIGFDSEGRVILSYHKFSNCNDNISPTQFYNARYEEGSWKIYQTTNWNYRWYFEGGGSLISEMGINQVYIENGEPKQSYSYKGQGSGVFVLDEATLKPIRIDPNTPWPYDVRTVRSQFPNMQTRVTTDQTSFDNGIQYIIRSEQLPSNRDQAWPEPWPEPIMLEVYKLQKK